MTRQKDAFSPSLAAGLALITSATLLLEISLTRIFSVTMWYHFAFMAISLALFGMAFGSVIVYLRPQWFAQEQIRERLAQLAIAFATSIVVAFWIHLKIPFIPAATTLGMLSVVLSFLLVAIPFVLSGIIVSLVLTRFPRHVGILYAWDLIGAAIGCLLLWALVRPLTGPGMILFSAAMAGTASLVFAWPTGAGQLKKIVGSLTGLFLLMALLQPHFRIMEIRWVKDAGGRAVSYQVPEKPMVEQWNSHSVITVFRDLLNQTFAWGQSPSYVETEPPQQFLLTIDGAAATVITKFTGKMSEIKHLRYDITSLAHHVRPESKVLVIGTGGGRDLLTALLFNPKSVVGVEINSDILHLINDTMASFTGHLDQHPKLRFINDEARSWVERSDEKFDVIQASLIDSWAATSAGAFVLTENSLYTVEAWEEFLSHLNEKGVLTMSRWWVRDRPGEMIRVTSLAYAALKRLGAENPREHVMIAATDFEGDSDSPNGVGTILVSRNPFTASDIDVFKQTCRQMKFRVLLTPKQSDRDEFARVLDPARHDAMVSSFPLNIAPPTDDSPFFFNMLRFKDSFSSGVHDQWITDFNTRAVALLATLFLLVLALCLLALLLPLWLHERGIRAKGAEALPLGMLSRHSLYFAAIGLGFILVEISQIQRLTLFLGHPVYSLTVVLFSILLATGIGSWITSRWLPADGSVGSRAPVMLGTVLLVALVAALALPPLLESLQSSSLAVRISLSAAVMFALGLPMGSAFPVGLRIADSEIPRATPWLWAINGALSVVGSVLAMMLSIGNGITFTALVGAFCYLVALIALENNRRRSRNAG